MVSHSQYFNVIGRDIQKIRNISEGRVGKRRKKEKTYIPGAGRFLFQSDWKAAHHPVILMTCIQFSKQKNSRQRFLPADVQLSVFGFYENGIRKCISTEKYKTFLR